ncbi:uncharacterized protein IL334_007105 [Kwoniella shivajii]|uniref:Peptidase A1 domain-containing protein n=1 Tax=Kwoniella shivajii TaxID=564305 RepID=A0ABZ1D8I9_9TREE|nr:hypothetical protein IL334_007105 [Kwoniella shivajii]
MTKHEASSNGLPPIARTLDSIQKWKDGSYYQGSIEERAIILKMTPHSPSADLEKRQEVNNAASSATISNPYAFPTDQNSNTFSQTNSVVLSAAVPSATQIVAVQDHSATAAAATGVNNPITNLEADDITGAGTIYTIDVIVEGVTMPVHIDTGSSQFWVAHDSCAACKQGGMQTINTALPDDCSTNNYTVNYAIGQVTGCFVSTSLTLGEDTLHNYSILAVTSVSGDTASQGVYLSGLIGLASAGQTPNGSPTVVSALYQQGLIQAPVVGFYLPRSGDNLESEITFGDPTTSEHADPSHFVNLTRQGNENGLYIVQMDSLNINGNAVTNSLNQKVYLDTGASAIAVPFSTLSEVWNSTYGYFIDVKDQAQLGNATVPCPNEHGKNHAQGLSVMFGGISFDVPYEDLVAEDEAGQCWPLITTLASIDNMWLLGDAFLHNVYHSVDVETGQVTIFGLSQGGSS